MATRIVEHTFMLVSQLELDEGIKHAFKKDGVRIDRRRLQTIANNAGKNMHGEPGLTPRQAAARAMQSYHNEFPSVQFPTPFFDGYVHAVAKIMSNRSPRVASKRVRDHQVSEQNMVAHQIATAPMMDCTVQLEIENMIDKRKRRTGTR